jgi:hypothetical protein
MNGGAYWQWYSGSCGGSAAGQGDLIVVSPTVTTTYYARSEGGGIEPGNCGSIVVTVNPVPQGILTANGPFCGQGNGKLTFTETNGAPGPFTIIYNDGASDRTASNVESGIAFSAGVNPVTTTTSYTLVSVTSANNCQRTSGFTQGSATITVNPSSLSITITPQEASLCPGSSLILTATASGGNLSYQWQKNGGNISNATSSTYTLENISETDKGKYTCIASNTCGAASSNASTLEVKSEAEISNSIPNQSKCMGETALFTINATGTNLSYQWTKDGTGTPIAGATNSAFTLTNLKKSDENLYSCIVSNDCGSKSIEPFLLLIESKPTINIYPVTQTKIEGESITYVLNPLGSPPLFYQWKKNNINIPDATGDSYKVASITCGDAGNYSCEISNNCGKITTPVGTLIVNGCGIFTVSGTVIYDNKNLTPMTSTAVYIETTEGVSIDSTMTDNSGLYTFFDLPNGSYKLTCKSEKAWGGGNPVDALLINKYFIGLYNFTGILRQKAADVTNDGRINPADALQINRRFVGLINHYSLNDWLFEVPVINANGSDILQDIKAICAGDVDGSYKP